MNTAVILLMMAMSLLTQVENTPNVSPEFRKQAEMVAYTAIDVAQSAIAEEQARVLTATPKEECSTVTGWTRVKLRNGWKELPINAEGKVDSNTVFPYTVCR